MPPRRGASSVCGCKRRSPDIGISCKYIEFSVAKTEEGWSTSCRFAWGLTTLKTIESVLLNLIGGHEGPVEQLVDSEGGFPCLELSG